MQYGKRRLMFLLDLLITISHWFLPFV